MTKKNILFIGGFIFLLAVTFITIYLISQQQDLRQRASEIIITAAECDAQTIACDPQFQQNKTLACANKSLAVDNLLSRDDSPCRGRDRAFVEQQLNQACTDGCVDSTPTPTASPTQTLTPTSTPSPSPTGSSTQPTNTPTASPTPTGAQRAPTATATPITATVPASPTPTSATMTLTPTGDSGITPTPTGILPTNTPSLTPTIPAAGELGPSTIIALGAVLVIILGGIILFSI